MIYMKHDGFECVTAPGVDAIMFVAFENQEVFAAWKALEVKADHEYEWQAATAEDFASNSKFISAQHVAGLANNERGWGNDKHLVLEGVEPPENYEYDFGDDNFDIEDMMFHKMFAVLQTVYHLEEEDVVIPFKQLN